MFQLLPCPSCQRSMVLRNRVSLQATLRCPSCQSQFVLGELLSNNYTQWEVVDDPETELADFRTSAGQHMVNTVQDDDGVELELQAETSDESATLSEASSVEEIRGARNEARKVDWSRFKPITHEEYQRMRRKATSPLWTFLQVVLGGLAAIPVSLYLIWHVVGTDIGGAAPAVARYLPWVVPEKYRPMARDDESRMDSFDSAQREMLGSPRISGEDWVDSVPDDARPKDPKTKLKHQTEEADVASSDNYFTTIRKCQDQLSAWLGGRDGEEAQRKKLAQALYSELTNLAAELNRIATDDPTARTIHASVDDFAKTIAEHADVKSLILAGAKAKLRDNSHVKRFPLAAVAKIVKVTELENQWTIVPESPAADERQLPSIFVPVDLAASIHEGDELLILGEFVQPEGENAPTSAEFRASYVYGFISK